MSDDGERRALRAQTVLDDEIFQEAVKELRENLIIKWVVGKRVEDREKTHSEITALESVVVKLRGIVTDAAFEKKLQERK